MFILLINWEKDDDELCKLIGTNNIQIVTPLIKKFDQLSHHHDTLVILDLSANGNFQSYSYEYLVNQLVDSNLPRTVTKIVLLASDIEGKPDYMPRRLSQLADLMAKALCLQHYTTQVYCVSDTIFKSTVIVPPEKAGDDWQIVTTDQPVEGIHSLQTIKDEDKQVIDKTPNIIDWLLTRGYPYTYMTRARPLPTAFFFLEKERAAQQANHSQNNQSPTAAAAASSRVATQPPALSNTIDIAKLKTLPESERIAAVENFATELGISISVTSKHERSITPTPQR